MSYKAASWTAVFSYLVYEVTLKLFVNEATSILDKVIKFSWTIILKDFSIPEKHDQTITRMSISYFVKP